MNELTSDFGGCATALTADRSDRQEKQLQAISRLLSTDALTRDERMGALVEFIELALRL